MLHGVEHPKKYTATVNPSKSEICLQNVKNYLCWVSRNEWIYTPQHMSQPSRDPNN